MAEKFITAARRIVPKSWRYAVQRYIPLTELKLWYRWRTNSLASVVSSTGTRSGDAYRFAIAANPAQYHQHYVKACLEMGYAFDVIHILADNWYEQVGKGRYDALLVWPDATLSLWSNMIKDRVELLEQQTHTLCFPSSREMWMYENKIRMADYLLTHHIAHPRTWVFTDRASCMRFAKQCSLPVVFKTTFGASATGVRILRDRRSLLSLVRKVFSRGVAPSGMDRRDRQWGVALFQEYVAEAKEWRLVRIGDSYFGHPKGKVGDFHSGSGAVLWDVPTERHLEFLYDITRHCGFESMAIDTFETPDGLLLVNELQTVFGASFSVDQTRVNGQAGRFVRREDRQWCFEPGDFARNACANERIRYLIDHRLARRR